MLLGAYPSEKDRVYSFVTTISMVYKLTKQMYCYSKAFHVYVLMQSRNTIGHRGDSKAEADVDTDGSPTRLPGLAT